MAATKKRKAKNRTKVEKAIKAAQKGTMKWFPFMSKFVLEKMYELIKTDIQTNKGFISLLWPRTSWSTAVLTLAPRRCTNT
jgi:hypothetical protein